MEYLSRYLVGPRFQQMVRPLSGAMAVLFAVSTPVAAQPGESDIRPSTFCDGLTSLTNFEFSVVEAYMEPASELMPERCRVNGRILPEIRFTMALPSDWNGRLYMAGNGGYAGSFSERVVPSAYGSVTVSTDTGHDRRREPRATFGLDRQKVIDFAYRSVHLTVQAAKQITTAYYGSPIRYSYFAGCSTGGRQALTSAQRFPDDFDGILVAAPILDYVGTRLAAAWEAQMVENVSITIEQLEMLAAAVYATCDGIDGLEDGLIEDPTGCGFDPATDLPVCDDASAGPNCFTRAQIDALRSIYDGPPFFPGRVVGTEVFVEGQDGRFSPFQRIIDPDPRSWIEPYFKYMAFEVPDTTYDWRTFDFAEDLASVEWLRSILDATNPDLRRFRDRGGKMIMEYGWADAALNPLQAVHYYETVLEEMGPPTAAFFRLFMVPGMFHCSGGVGRNQLEHEGDRNASSFDYLEAWVERDVAPEALLGLRVEQDSVLWSRPICMYPRVARYTGSGDSTDAANFECVES
jgi:feruloyl esterase